MNTSTDESDLSEQEDSFASEQEDSFASEQEDSFADDTESERETTDESELSEQENSFEGSTDSGDSTVNDSVEDPIINQSSTETSDEKNKADTIRKDYGIRRVDLQRVLHEKKKDLPNPFIYSEDNLKAVISKIAITPDTAKFQQDELRFKNVEQKHLALSEKSATAEMKFQDIKRKFEKKKRSYEKSNNKYDEKPVKFDSDNAQALYGPEERFKLAYYVRTVASKYTFGFSITGEHSPQISYSSVLFFYRTKPAAEIFYIVVNQAWQHFDWCADIEFPNLLCARLLNPDGPISRKAKQLSGNIAHEDIIYRDAEKIVNIFKPSFEYNMSAYFRKDCSIFGLPLTINSVDATPNVPTKRKRDFEALKQSSKAEVGQKFFKIASKNLQIADFFHLCHHFSKIYFKTPTCLTNGENEADTNTYDKLFEPIEPENKKLLDRQMMKKLFATRVQDNEYISQQFIFVHPKVRDFEVSTRRQLIFKGKPVTTESLGKHTLKSVMEIVERQLRESIQTDTLDSRSILEIVKSRLSSETPANRETKTIDNLSKLIQKVSVTYEKDGILQKACNILRCIGGFMQGAHDNHLYWRIHGQWYEVKQDLVARAHETFIVLLNTKGFLLSEKDVHFSKNKWMGKLQLDYFRSIKENKNKRLEKEGIFNAIFGYYKSKRFIVGDKILFQGIELFDVMEIKKTNRGDEAYLYHVKSGFNTATREACAQIQNAFRIIRNPSNTICKELESFYEEIKKKSKNQTVFGSLTPAKFVELLQNAKFVYAVFDESKAKLYPSKYEKDKKVSRSLLQEKDTKYPVTVENLEAVLRDNDKKSHVSGLNLTQLKSLLELTGPKKGFRACAKTIQKLLIEGEYLDERNRATKKFLTVPDSKFQLEGLDKKDSEKVLKCLNHFRSSYLCRTFVPHLEIIRTWLDLREKFAIFEISSESDSAPPNEFHKQHFETLKKPTSQQPVLDIESNVATSMDTEPSQIMTEMPGSSSGYSSGLPIQSCGSNRELNKLDNDTYSDSD